MSVTRRKFGKTKDGEPVTLYTITNKMGNSVSIMDYGATVQSINIVDAEGEVIDCCLGYNTVAEYEEHTDFMGACIGRVGNRIGGSSFSLNGQTYTLAANEGENHLHGGLKGFDKQMFKPRSTVMIPLLSAVSHLTAKKVIPVNLCSSSAIHLMTVTILL